MVSQQLRAICKIHQNWCVKTHFLSDPCEVSDAGGRQLLIRAFHHFYTTI